MKFYAWIVPYNMGAPPGAMAELAGPNFKPHLIPYPTGPVYETQFPWMSKFLLQNPQYQLVDRKGQRYHYG
jgi:hypothetical protein